MKNDQRDFDGMRRAPLRRPTVLRRVCGAIVALTLAGCATSTVDGMAIYPASWSAADDKPGSAGGYLVMSLTNREQPSALRRVFGAAFKTTLRVCNAAGGSGVLLSDPPIPDFERVKVEGAGRSGLLFTPNLRPGRYALCGFSFFEGTGAGYRTWAPKTPVNIPFEIEAGKITYLGEFEVRRVTGENLFGLEVTAGGYFLVHNSLARDIAAARSQLPRVNALPLIDATPGGAALDSRFFRVGEPLPSS